MDIKDVDASTIFVLPYLRLRVGSNAVCDCREIDFFNFLRLHPPDAPLPSNKNKKWSKNRLVDIELIKKAPWLADILTLL